MRRVLLQGFIVVDYMPQWDVTFRDIGQWLKEGIN
jgi:NADPH-dependent curcumin reductase CurA